MLPQELRSPHATVLVEETVLQAFIHQENGRATNGQSRSSAGQKKGIIQPGTTLQVMERGFGNPDVQQNSPGVPRSQALGARGTFSAEGKSRVEHYFFCFRR